MGIEPTSTAWEAVVLPMNYIRWSEWRDLNPRPLGPEPSTLPTALHPDAAINYYRCYLLFCQALCFALFYIENRAWRSYNRSVELWGGVL